MQLIVIEYFCYRAISILIHFFSWMDGLKKSTLLIVKGIKRESKS
jgi:hypothetical protein